MNVQAPAVATDRTASTIPARGLRMGVIVNPASSRNRAHAAALQAAISRCPATIVRAAPTAQDTAHMIREMLATGIDVLAVAGGDGTLQQAFATLLAKPTCPLPMIAVLPGGTTNMIGQDVGARHAAAAQLDALTQGMAQPGATLRLHRRRLMALQTSATAAAAYGLFLGAAGIVQGTLLSRRSVDRIGMRDSAGPLTGLLSLVGPMLLGRNPVRAVDATVYLDGTALPYNRYLVLAASTLQRLSLGINPFWGTGPGPIRATLVREHPHRLARVLWPALRGRPHPDLTSDNGYVSRNVTEIEIEIGERVVLDGEFHQAAAGDRLRVSAGPELVFVSP